MTIDILALDALPETEPVALADLDSVGLMRCVTTCWWTCAFTCSVTEY